MLAVPAKRSIGLFLILPVHMSFYWIFFSAFLAMFWWSCHLWHSSGKPHDFYATNPICMAHHNIHTLIELFLSLRLSLVYFREWPMAGVEQCLFTHYMEELTCRMKLPAWWSVFQYIPCKSHECFRPRQHFSYPQFTCNNWKPLNSQNVTHIVVWICCWSDVIMAWIAWLCHTVYVKRSFTYLLILCLGCLVKCTSLLYRITLEPFSSDPETIITCWKY